MLRGLRGTVGHWPVSILVIDILSLCHTHCIWPTAEKALRARVKQIHLHFFLWQLELAGEIGGCAAWQLGCSAIYWWQTSGLRGPCSGGRRWMEITVESAKGLMLSVIWRGFGFYSVTSVYFCLMVNLQKQFKSKKHLFYFRLVWKRPYLTHTAMVHVQKHYICHQGLKGRGCGGGQETNKRI